MSRILDARGKPALLIAALVVVALVASVCGASGLASTNSGAQATVAVPTTMPATEQPVTEPTTAIAATEAPAATAEATAMATEMPAATSEITGTTSMTGTTGTGATADSAALALSETDQLGKFLVDDKGMTLYLYTKDTPGTSNCYGGCAAAWPPLLGSSATVSGSDLDQSLVGTTTRTDGSTQITYNGWPLYYYAKDKQAGDVTGQDVGGVWYVVSPKGDKVE